MRESRTKLVSVVVLLCLIVVLVVAQAQLPAAAAPSRNAKSGGPYNYFLPFVARNIPQPGISITSILPCRTTGYISGIVKNVSFVNYKVAVYIYVSGWWNKPYWSNPLTAIAANGTWQTYVTTGGNDPMATEFAAFLVPNGYNPPLLAGDYQFPSGLYSNAVAYTIVDRNCALRQITFSGYTWSVKASVSPAGPGPNYFSDKTSDVWVDSQGKLHLTIINHDGHWWCTEVINNTVLGYGTYVFRLASRADQIDPHAVLGFFTWDDSSADYSHREIDVELSRWGIVGNDNSQYVVQPYTTSGNMHRFNLVLGNQSTHGFIWQPGSIYFQSLNGLVSIPGSSGVLQSWAYTGSDIPPKGSEHARINLWLFNSVAPAGTIEVIVDSFQFIPPP